jgi:hypothetical protein
MGGVGVGGLIWMKEGGGGGARGAAAARQAKQVG